MRSKAHPLFVVLVSTIGLPDDLRTLDDADPCLVVTGCFIMDETVTSALQRRNAVGASRTTAVGWRDANLLAQKMLRLE